jgi:predicted esterase
MATILHQGQPALHIGAALDQTKAAVIMLHGRGSNAQDILSLSSEFKAADVAYIAPQAAGYQWYPQRFIAPLESNEPYLSSALAAVGDLVTHLVAAGIPQEKIVLLGFSQGACLALEYVARHAGRYGGAIALSGALIGPPGTPRNYPSSMSDTPVFLGCSDVDFHIPLDTVVASAEVFRRMQADVTERIYPGMGHTVNEDEIAFVNDLLRSLVG